MGIQKSLLIVNFIHFCWAINIVLDVSVKVFRWVTLKSVDFKSSDSLHYVGATLQSAEDVPQEFCQQLILTSCLLPSLSLQLARWPALWILACLPTVMVLISHFSLPLVPVGILAIARTLHRQNSMRVTRFLQHGFHDVSLGEFTSHCSKINCELIIKMYLRILDTLFNATWKCNRSKFVTCSWDSDWTDILALNIYIWKETGSQWPNLPPQEN